MPASAPTTPSPALTAPPDTGTAPPAGAGPGGTDDAGADAERLARLAVVDAAPPGGYARDLFPTWLDLDGDGCDAREQALVAASDPPATVGPGCRVATGAWFSAYDGATLTEPSAVDIDHVVPLADAWRSGAAAWTTDRRARFANDPLELWPVSGSVNRAKGDSPPDRWRPPRRAAWCAYARRWIDVKLAHGLTATTAERDALGQMLATCPPVSAPSPSPTGAPAAPATTSPPTTAGSSDTGGGPYYANCAAARAAGAAPIHRGEPGYREALDGDHDGVACE